MIAIKPPDPMDRNISFAAEKGPFSGPFCFSGRP
jgi:hypothetical protein